jgi:hypothetical protein
MGRDRGSCGPLQVMRMAISSMTSGRRTRRPVFYWGLNLRLLPRGAARDGSCVSHPNHANPVILSEIAWLADIYVWHDCKIHMIGERRSQRERHPEKDNGTRNRGAPGSFARSSAGDYRDAGSGAGPARRLTRATSWN